MFLFCGWYLWSNSTRTNIKTTVNQLINNIFSFASEKWLINSKEETDAKRKVQTSEIITTSMLNMFISSSSEVCLFFYLHDWTFFKSCDPHAINSSNLFVRAANLQNPKHSLFTNSVNACYNRLSWQNHSKNPIFVVHKLFPFH